MNCASTSALKTSTIIGKSQGAHQTPFQKGLVKNGSWILIIPHTRRRISQPSYINFHLNPPSMVDGWDFEILKNGWNRVKSLINSIPMTSHKKSLYFYWLNSWRFPESWGYLTMDGFYNRKSHRSKLMMTVALWLRKAPYNHPLLTMIKQLLTIISYTLSINHQFSHIFPPYLSNDIHPVEKLPHRPWEDRLHGHGKQAATALQHRQGWVRGEEGDLRQRQRLRSRVVVPQPWNHDWINDYFSTGYEWINHSGW